ncbi:hypothetical protein ANI_1_296044 [Paecilomyces variotii No. 5]|uniref:Uncharacterized protein n=1 Tax=Byssochlamys spectabilis (strain No. 5 / NBRC 109023) TaxID=1356009 RepID=V5G9M7_BYSSN|nr:hypothetical protein ANI_1_296044 [Paecilomyces variotii No. 5]
MKFWHISALVSLHICIVSSVNTTPSRRIKRGAETNATLFAYGTNSSAWPIAYGLNDGLLYVTETPDNASADLTAVTWDLPAITDENWIVNATLMNGTSAGSLYIRPENNYAVGVLPMTRVANFNGTVSGFALFATQLVYNNNTELQAQFWARPTNTTGIYSLCWIVEQDQVENDSFPVVIKGVENS